MFIFFIFMLGSCTCKDLVAPNGGGNCQGPTSTKLGNKVFCYVTQPSSCSDVLDSSTNQGEKYSAESCGQTGIEIYMHNVYTNIPGFVDDKTSLISSFHIYMI